MKHRLLRKALTALTFFVATLSAPLALAQARFDFDTTPGNLPKTVVPSRYALALDLDPARDTFTGRAEITLEVRQPVSVIVLHARELEPSRIELAQAGRAPRMLRRAAGPIAESWSLAPTDAAPIAPGRYTVRIDYRGRVNGSGVGLFRAPYGSAAKPQVMLATQLESVDARAVFPNFDEPSFRAVFELTVRAPRALEVLANMPRAAVRTEGAVRVHRFKPTPPMPSYLMAVSVGRYDALEGSADGVPLRILTAPGKRAQAHYAMQATRRIVPFYNAYFGVPYALPKLDQLAVPSVRDGAMEDWGLISYTETTLLYDPARSSPRTQRQVFNVVAHEVAHQWFGDLVTAASWEEIWLNEAFATWMADKATVHFNPQWHTELGRREWTDRAMAEDAGNATRAIRSGPVSEAAVFDVFDSITYVKGGAVLGMLEQWLGAEPFRRGLAAYMKERKFSNATAGDLWHHMAQGSRLDVAAVAASWTDQPGFPVVEASSRCNGDRTEVTLAQRRLRDGGAAAPTTVPADAPPALWKIPVRLARGTEQSTVLLGTARQTFELPGCSNAPLIANAGGIGFYRVKYDAASADAVAAQFTQLPAADQVAVLSDTFALAQAGELPVARWFALVEQIPRVNGPARTTLFDLAGSGFGFLDDAMAGTPAQPLLRAAARRVFAPELTRLGWEARRGEDAQTPKLRGMLIEQLAQFDDAATIEQALRRFDAAEAGRTPLPAALRAPVLQAAGMHADRARFDRLLAHFKAAAGEEDRWLYANAVAAGRDESRARELLAASLTGVTTANIAIALPGLVNDHSPFGELAYDFTLTHWSELAKIAGNAMFARFNLLPKAADRFNDPARAARLIDDQRRNAGADGAMPAARTASHITLLAAVRQRDAQALQTLLAQ
jgi:aminopeptidase N